MVVMCDWHYYQIMSYIHCLGKCMTLDLYSCIPWEWSTLRPVINLGSPLWCMFFAGWFLIMLTYAHLSPLCPVRVAGACRRPSLIRILHLLIMQHVNPTFRGFGLGLGFRIYTTVRTTPTPTIFFFQNHVVDSERTWYCWWGETGSQAGVSHRRLLSTS